MGVTATFTRADVASFLARADATLAEPPRWPWVERHPGRGRRLFRFALPLALAAPLNRSRHAQGWQLARERSRVLGALAGQLVAQLRSGTDGTILEPLGWCADGRALRPMLQRPLPGRPMVRAIRFSSVAPDPTAAWHKVAVDCLRVARPRAGKLVPGLGILEDDRPDLLELREWCEYAPPGKGFAVIEVWSGETEAR